MEVLISSLYCGYEKIDELHRFLDSLEGKFGGEYTVMNKPEYIKFFEDVVKMAYYPISFHGPLIDAEPVSKKGSADYGAFISAYEKTFELAKKYNARHVVYHTSYLPFKEDELERNFDICVENTAKIVDMANKANVKLLIENLPNPPGGLALIDGKRFFELFKYVDAKAIIDTGHANIMGLDYERFIRENCDRVQAYHFHNNQGKWDTHNSIFDGTFDFEKMKAVYNELTPDADIVIEYKPTCGLSFTDIAKHGEYIMESFIKFR